MLLDRREELHGLDRLGDIRIHPGGEAALAVPCHRVGRQRNDGDMCAGETLPRPYRPRRLEAVHLGHLNVHQHDFETLRLECGDRLASVLHGDYRVTALLE